MNAHTVCPAETNNFFTYNQNKCTKKYTGVVIHSSCTVLGFTISYTCS